MASYLDETGLLKLWSKIKSYISNATAGAAKKIATARNISLTGDVSGSAVFDGSSNISINTTVRKTCFVGSDNASTNGWYKVASQTMSGYGDSNIIFAVTSTYGNYKTGIFSLQIRSDNTSIWCPVAKWLVRNGFGTGDIRIVINGMTYTMYVYKDITQYGRIQFEILSESSIHTRNSGITLYNNSTKESTEPSATVKSSDGGTVAVANSAGAASKLDTSAGSATQPVFFSNGKPSACSYTLGKSVPSNAVFTDTNTWRGIQNNLTSDATDQSLSAAQGKALNTNLTSHAGNKSNPHGVTKSQVGLANVENKSSATIRGEMTALNVNTALGYTAAKQTDANKAITGISASGTTLVLTQLDGTTKYVTAELVKGQMIYCCSNSEDQVYCC